MEPIERITHTNTVGTARYGHELRYRLAAGFIRPTDTVLDAACGTGYGANILGACTYIGVDSVDFREVPSSVAFIRADLQSWQCRFAFDVALSFETIEHLDDYAHFISTLKQARRWILASVPIVPTVGINPYHKQNFGFSDLARLFVNDEWECYQTLYQETELSEIGIFRRR